ncbi:MAG: glycosyltransferase, partial [Paramuribaculum sp.]|nr:glycosyltransferase [Paramuribaculum sp.]
MHIAHVTYGLGMGGIETMLVNISREQAAAGHQVHVIVLNDIVEKSLARQIGEGVNLHLLGRPCGSYNPIYIIRMNRLLKSLNADVIHLHYSSLSRYLFYPALKRRMCVTLHELFRPEVVKRLDRSGPVFAISDMVRDDIASKLGLEATTVYNGIYPEQLRRRPSDRKPSSPFTIV